MIFIKIRALEAKIINQELSEKDFFNYFIMYSLLAILFCMPDLNTDENNKTTNIFYWIESSIDIFTILLTLILTFKVNQRGDDIDFVKRYVAISFVNTVRLLFFIFLIAIPIIIISAILINIFSSKIDIWLFLIENLNIDYIFMNIIYIMMYVIFLKMMLNSFNKINNNNAKI